MPKGPRGHPPLKPSTTWGKYIHDRLETLGINRLILARRLRIAPSTVTRLLNGQVSAATIDIDLLCDILQLHGPERQTFLEVIRDAFISLKPIRSADFLNPNPEPMESPIVLKPGLRLDGYNASIVLCCEALQGQRDPAKLLVTFQPVYDEITHLVESNLAKQTDPAFLDIEMRAGMLQAALQETVFGWWTDRPRITNQTYSALMWDVLPNVRPVRKSDDRSELLRTERLRLDLRRAVLYREGKNFEKCDEVLARSPDDLRIQQLLINPQDAVYIVAYEAQKIHTLAAQNCYETWQDELKRAAEYVGSAPVSTNVRKRLFDILSFTYGVGTKRFMWYNRTKSRGIRTYFAEQAYRTLHQLRVSGLGAQATHDINLYHSSVPLSYVEPELECSEIDALIWLDERAAFEHGMSLMTRVEHRYPTLIRKIREQVDLSLDRQGLNATQKHEAIQAWRIEHGREEV